MQQGQSQGNDFFSKVVSLKSSQAHHFFFFRTKNSGLQNTSTWQDDATENHVLSCAVLGAESFLPASQGLFVFLSLVVVNTVLCTCHCLIGFTDKKTIMQNWKRKKTKPKNNNYTIYLMPCTGSWVLVWHKTKYYITKPILSRLTEIPMQKMGS